MDTDTMTIREMCEAFDVTPRTLRYYETKELLAPLRKGQKRLYTKRDMVRLTLILRGKRFGFTLEDIRQVLELYYVGDKQLTQMERTTELAEIKLSELERQRAELDETISALEKHLQWAREMIAQTRMKKTG